MIYVFKAKIFFLKRAESFKRKNTKKISLACAEYLSKSDIEIFEMTGDKITLSNADLFQGNFFLYDILFAKPIKRVVLFEKKKYSKKTKKREFTQ